MASSPRPIRGFPATGPAGSCASACAPCWQQGTRWRWWPRATGTCRDDDRVTRIPAEGLFYAGGAPEALEGAGTLPRAAAWGRALGFSLALLGHLARRGRGWDAVESHWLLPCGLAAAVALPGLPHRAHVHGGDLYLLERLPWGRQPGASVLPQSSRGDLRQRSRCATASPRSPGLRRRSWGLARGSSRPRSTGPSSVGPATRNDGRPGARLPCERPFVLAAGRLVPIKGYDRLILAVARMAEAARPVVLIAGEGPERDRLARRARAAGVDLRLPGALDQPALARHMAAADLFVHPCRTLPSGRSEGMPLVVREALARGLPVVASASGGLAELAGEGGLVLVPADDAGALAAAIARALGRSA